MKAIDLFCGAGGLTNGLRRAGWDVVAGIDVDAAVGPTYRRNNPGSRFVQADLRLIKNDDVRDLAQGIHSRELLLAGCAPCQPFSKQRGRRGIRERSDATLLREFARLVAALRPRAVLMENVPGIAAVPGFSAFRRFVRTLRELGYDCDECVLNARDFGVPQHRRRRVLQAIHDAPVWLPSSSPSGAGDNDLTVRSAIERFPPIEAGEAHPHILNHYAAKLSPLNLARIKATPTDGGSRRDWHSRLVLECHRPEGTGFSDVYGRMWWDRAAPTLTSRCNSLSNGRFGHPEQHRAISLREAAALQSFSDDYDFFGSRNAIARWIGNAVPVAFAEVLGAATMKAAG
ncbi:MAG: DNA cytosine methyltransferase [Chloroflexi bacterium]|nr:DNA cytosine methyltransferase [Chloroflexota bacterium]